MGHPVEINDSDYRRLEAAASARGQSVREVLSDLLSSWPQGGRLDFNNDDRAAAEQWVSEIEAGLGIEHRDIEQCTQRLIDDAD